jgi:hypothetical protein
MYIVGSHPTLYILIIHHKNSHGAHVKYLGERNTSIIQSGILKIGMIISETMPVLSKVIFVWVIK